MVKLKPKCSYCKNKFTPNVRLRERQKTCGLEICRRAPRSLVQRRWRKINYAIEVEYQTKRREFREKNFWKEFRKSHPESTIRNRILTKVWKSLRREGLQRRLDILQVVEDAGKIISFSEFATRHRSTLLECVSRKASLTRGMTTDDHTGTSG
jgi:hypothetical protein